MNKQKCLRSALAIAATTMLLTGCQSNTDTGAETEALKEQITQLEQQIAALQQQAADNNVPDDNAVSSNTTDETPSAAESAQEQTDTSVRNDQQSDSNADNSTQMQPTPNAESNHIPGHDEERNHNPSQYDQNGGVSNQPDNSTAGLTTYTMQELGSMVDAFAEKTNSAAPGGTAAADLEQFFALKQEEKQIDDLLDRHEDELEYLYKNQSLTREDYKRLERELELLEDKLDAAEDQLEYVFGIDD